MVGIKIIRINMKYFKDLNNVVYAYESDGSQDDYILDDLIPISEQEAEELSLNTNKQNTSEENKLTAIYLLIATDWAVQSDVRNTNNNPHLINTEEFDAYRLELRRIAINPPDGNIDFPIKPQENWSV
jgi:hypothetical protein